MASSPISLALPIVGLVGPDHLISDMTEAMSKYKMRILSTNGIFPHHRPTAETGAAAGIFRADWIQCFTQDLPSVVVVVIERSMVLGGPSSWTSVTAQLDQVIKHKAPNNNDAHTKVVVAIHSPLHTNTSIPPDKAAMICKYANIDKDSIAIVSPSDEASSQHLAHICLRHARSFYAATAQTQLDQHATLNSPSQQASLRIAMKLSILAALQNEAGTALQTLKEAQDMCGKLLSTSSTSLSSSSPQIFVELRCVSGLIFQLQVSIQQIQTVDDAFIIQQLQSLLAACNKSMHVGNSSSNNNNNNNNSISSSSALLADNQQWLAQQYIIAAKALRDKQTQSQYYYEAAKCLIARRKAGEAFLKTAGSFTQPLTVQPGPYVGQILLAGTTSRPLTDDEFLRYLEVEAMKPPVPLSAATLLEKSLKYHQQGDGMQSRTLTIKSLLAQELMTIDASKAASILGNVADVYRSTRWQGPLFDTLRTLIQCTDKLGNEPQKVVYMLEAASITQDAQLAQQAITLLVSGGSRSINSQQSRFHYNVEPVSMGINNVNTNSKTNSSRYNSPWLSVVTIAAGFNIHTPSSSSSSQDHQHIVFQAALHLNLPHSIPIQSAKLTVADQITGLSTVDLTNSNNGDTIHLSSSVVVLEATVPILSSQQYLRAISITLQFSDSATLTINLPDTSHGPSILSSSSSSSSLAVALSHPGVFALTPSLFNTSAPIELELDTVSVALQGEQFPLVVRVKRLFTGTSSSSFVRISVSHREEKKKPFSWKLIGHGKHLLNNGLIPLSHDNNNDDILLQCEVMAKLAGSAVIQVDVVDTSTGTSSTDPHKIIQSATSTINIEVPFQAHLSISTSPDTHCFLSGASTATTTTTTTTTDTDTTTTDTTTTDTRDIPPSTTTTTPSPDGGMTCLSPSLPSTFTLPMNVQCIAVATITSIAPCNIDVLSVEWEKEEEEEGRKKKGVVVKVDKIIVKGNEASITTGMKRKDIYTVLFSIIVENRDDIEQQQSSITLDSLGSLVVEWKRGERPLSRLVPTQSSSSIISRWITPLPAAIISVPYLITTLHHPVAVVDQENMHYDLEVDVHNGKSSSSLSVGVRVGDAHGSMVMGNKTNNDVFIAPNGVQKLKWRVVPYQISGQGGRLPLPEIWVETSMKHAVNLSRGHYVYI